MKTLLVFAGVLCGGLFAAEPILPEALRADLIRKLAEDEEVFLADVHAEWRKELEKGTPQESLMSQGNHPNPEGHQLAAGVICRLFWP